jgi:hypothetical protein
MFGACKKILDDITAWLLGLRIGLQKRKGVIWRL